MVERGYSATDAKSLDVRWPGKPEHGSKIDLMDKQVRILSRISPAIFSGTVTRINYNEIVLEDELTGSRAELPRKAILKLWVNP
jgi:hypothetical protein